MKLLIVDDQKTVADSLKCGIDWASIGITQVYTGYSAKEARLILMNFAVDILLTDIEMPDEDGLSLVEWVNEHRKEMVCVFLTSHMEFDYARKAVQLQSFDYILQPAKFDEIKDVVKRAGKKRKVNQSIRQLRDKKDIVIRQRNELMESLAAKMESYLDQDADRIFTSLKELFKVEYQELTFFPAAVKIVRWRKDSEEWDSNLVIQVISNVLEELLEKYGGKICITGHMEQQFKMLIAADLSSERLLVVLEEFYRFVKRHMDFTVGLYIGEKITGPVAEELREVVFAAVKGEKEGIIHLRENNGLEEKADGSDVVTQVIAYVKANIGKNITRTEVAGQVYLHEEYLSRVFKQQTGYSIKSYILSEKINAAKRMLEQTGLSISIISSKVGFDNFSHFSRIFKKYTGCSPQEYRKKVSWKK